MERKRGSGLRLCARRCLVAMSIWVYLPRVRRSAPMRSDFHRFDCWVWKMVRLLLQALTL